jgi:hypothetical protein
MGSQDYNYNNQFNVINNDSRYSLVFFPQNGSCNFYYLLHISRDYTGAGTAQSV